ncbi:MAG TPA: DUF3311 domain-containing protein [Methyloceanibacter sp.]|nr:DUF3311 domain-containing protein [Methyloceanibacter sp.]
MQTETPKGRWPRYAPRLLLVIPFVMALWVPSYNRIEPKLADIPFFYWYQLTWVLVGAVIVLAVYLIETRLTHVTARTRLDQTGTPGDVL